MSNIKAILFDFDDTLTKGPVGWYYPYEELVSKFNFTKEQIKIAKEFDREAYIKYYQYPGSKNIKTREQEYELHCRVYDELLTRVSYQDGGELVEYLIKRRMEELEFELEKGTESLLNDLSRQHKLGIISNALPSRAEEVKRSRIGHLFSVVLISNIFGHGKPDKEIYQEAVNQLNVAPSEILFIDDREHFLDGAKDVGMEVKLLDRDKKIGKSKYPIVNKLSDI